MPPHHSYSGKFVSGGENWEPTEISLSFLFPDISYGMQGKNIVPGKDTTTSVITSEMLRGQGSNQDVK